MAFLIGFLITQYPYVTAAALFASTEARDLYARNSGRLVVENPEIIRAVVEQRFGKGG